MIQNEKIVIDNLFEFWSFAGNHPELFFGARF